MQLPSTPTSRVCLRAYETGGVSGPREEAGSAKTFTGVGMPRLGVTSRGVTSLSVTSLGVTSLGVLGVLLLSAGLSASFAAIRPLAQQTNAEQTSAAAENHTAIPEIAAADEKTNSPGTQPEPDGQSSTAEQASPTAPVKPSIKVAPSAKDVTPTAVNLLSSSLEDNWELFSSKPDTRLSDVWKVVDANGKKLLICTGTPKGFLLTKRKYQNFDLSFEWKYAADPNGNSGVLAFTRNEPRLWPTSMQVQLHQPSAGSIFPSGDATSDNTTDANDLALPVGQWNKCRVVARNGKVSVEINGKPAGEVSGCNPSQGSLALQSEGSETHFRNIFIRELPDVEPSIADETSTSLPPTKPDSPPGTVETDG